LPVILINEIIIRKVKNLSNILLTERQSINKLVDSSKFLFDILLKKILEIWNSWIFLHDFPDLRAQQSKYETGVFRIDIKLSKLRTASLLVRSSINLRPLFPAKHGMNPWDTSNWRATVNCTLLERGGGVDVAFYLFTSENDLLFARDVLLCKLQSNKMFFS